MADPQQPQDDGIDLSAGFQAKPQQAPAPGKATSQDFMNAAATQHPSNNPHPILPQGGTDDIDLSAGIQAKPNLHNIIAPGSPQPSTASEQTFGVHPLADTASSIWQHTKGLVTSAYHGLADDPTPEELQMEKDHPDLLGANPNMVERAANRALVEPTIRAAREAKVLRAAGGPQSSLTAPSSYDTEGNNVPTAGSKLIDAIPIYGPWARAYTDEAYNKGLVPATAGLATDVLAPELAKEGLGATARGVKKVVGAPLDATRRAAAGVTAGNTRDVVRNIADENADIQAATDKKNSDQTAAHAATLDALNEQNAQAKAAAVAKARQLHQTAADSNDALQAKLQAKHDLDTQDVQAHNQAQIDDAAVQTEANSTAAQQSHADEAQRFQDLTDQHAELDKQIYAGKNQLMSHVNELNTNTRNKIKGDFNSVAAAVNSRANPLVDASPIIDTADKLGKSLSDTADGHPLFKAIVKQAAGQSGIEEAKETLSQQYAHRPYDQLEADNPLKKTIDEGVQEMFPEQPPTDWSFGQLRRFSTKIGNAAYNMQDQFVKKALYDLKGKVDDTAQTMADQAGVGPKHRQAIKDWSSYNSVFNEPTGPSGSASPLSKSVLAEDAENATAPLLNTKPHVAERASQMLTGEHPSVGGIYDNPGGGALLDKLRQNIAAKKSLPAPKAPEPYVEPEPVQPKLKALPEPTVPAGPNYPNGKVLPALHETSKVVMPGQEGIPALADTTPPTPTSPDFKVLDSDKLERMNTSKINTKVEQLRALTRWQINSLAGLGISSALGAAHFLTGSASHAGALLGGLGIAGFVGTRALRMLLDNDQVIKDLAKPTIAQYQEVMKLPPEQRPGVEAAMRTLAIQAKKAGKLKSDSPWINAFQTFLRPTVTGATKLVGPVSAGAGEQDQEQ